MKAPLKRWHPVAMALGVAATVVILGCGGDESGLGRRYPVKGKVAYKGAPVAHGTVHFIPTKPAPPEGRAAQGEITNGEYTLSTTGGGDGALPGEYNVAVIAKDFDLKSAASPKEEGGMIHQGDTAHQKAIKGAKSLIPDKYGLSESSGLKATVDSSTKALNFDLTD